MAMQRRRRAPMRRRRRRGLAELSRHRIVRGKVDEFDYKDVITLQRMLTAHGKMHSRKRSGLTAKEQRSAALAVKRARFMALLPYVS